MMMAIKDKVKKIEADVEAKIEALKAHFHAPEWTHAIASHIVALEARIEALEAAVKKAV